MAQHISIFMENKPGKLEKITQLLSAEGINLRAFSVADAGQYGIVKILVDNPDLADKALNAGNIACKKRPIIVALVDDRPGGLHSLLQMLTRSGINITDCYGFVIASRKEAAVVIETEMIAEAEKTLKSEGVRVLTEQEIYSL